LNHFLTGNNSIIKLLALALIFLSQSIMGFGLMESNAQFIIKWLIHL